MISPKVHQNEEKPSYEVSKFARGLKNKGAIVTPNTSYPLNSSKLHQMAQVEVSDWEIPYVDTGIQVELCDTELWELFSRVGTEMIISKLGRKMFPKYKVKISGLQAEEYYCVIMDIVNIDNYKYSYQTIEKQWIVSGVAKWYFPPNIYLHPKSPAKGGEWMKETVAFTNLKLTNYEQTKTTNRIHLNSMRRYRPRIHVARTDDVNRLPDVAMATFSFPQTIFIAVTGYQNNEISNLKIKHNPYARAYRENKETASKPNS